MSGSPGTRPNHLWHYSKYFDGRPHRSVEQNRACPGDTGEPVRMGGSGGMRDAGRGTRDAVDSSITHHASRCSASEVHVPRPTSRVPRPEIRNSTHSPDSTTCAILFGTRRDPSGQGEGSNPQFPIGGTARERGGTTNASHDSVKLRGRRYSPDERRLAVETDRFHPALWLHCSPRVAMSRN